MKKYFNFAFAGAIALIGTCGFIACTSDEEAVENNPTYDPIKQEVTTQFVLNVSSASQATRQSSTTVQQDPNFRGLQDAKLIALSTGNSSYVAPYDGEDVTGFDVNKTFDLGTLYGNKAVTASANEASSSNRVLQLAMPLKADAMLVYARAIPSTGEGSSTEENGKVTVNISTNPSSTTFDLCSRLNGLTSRYNQSCALAAAILNTIMAAEVSSLAAGDFTHNGYKNVAALDALNWKAIATAYDGGTTLAPLAEILAKAYSTLVNIRSGEVRAGSGAAVEAVAQALYNTAITVYAATATTDDEANAQRLADEITKRIGLFFNFDTEGNITEWKSIGNATETNTIIKNLIDKGVVTAATWESQFGLVKTGDVRNLPTGFGLPVGAAVLFMGSDGKFMYKNPSTSLIDQSKDVEAANYMYPAELLYFDNSALRVSDTEKKSTDYPDGVNPWDTESQWSGWTTGAITSTTRSVAVKNNINYGVAMLQTKVALEGSSFLDNRNAIVTSESNQELTADDVKKFKLTGVLIGGQNHQMGWNYLAKANTTSDWDYIIYDSKIAGSGTIPTPTGEENYTLVFDNYRVGTGGGVQADQTDVYVALEFENQSQDFYGRGNMIRYGGKFYLVGKLTLGENRIADANWPAHYAIPPYSAGATNKISRIFIQDFMTTATFKIGNKSLQNAFVTVPDLRSSQTSLGLSVDLKWQTGLSFETVLGQ